MAKMITAGLPEYPKTSPEIINLAALELEKGTPGSKEKFMEVASRFAISEAIKLVERTGAFEAQDDAISEALMTLWGIADEIEKGTQKDKPDKVSLIGLYVFGKVNKFIRTWRNHCDPKTHFRAIEEGRPTRVKEVSIDKLQIAVINKDFQRIEITEVFDLYLNEKEKKIVYFKLDGMTDREIAPLLSLTAAGVGFLRNRAFTKLEEALS